MCLQLQSSLAPPPLAGGCDDYSIIVNFNALNSKISKRNLYSK